MRRSGAYILFLLLGLGKVAFGAPPRPVARTFEVEGVAVIPHVRAEGMRYRQPASPDMGARIQLFIRAGDGAGPSDLLRVDGKTAEEWISSKGWHWHDTPSVWTPGARTVPSGARMVWQWNQVRWDPGEEKEIEYGPPGKEPLLRARLRLSRPEVWISALTFLGSQAGTVPDTMVLYLANESGRPVQMTGCRLYLPKERTSWQQMESEREIPWSGSGSGSPLLFPADGRIAPGEKGGLRAAAGPLPLTYGIVELQLRDRDGKVDSVRAYQRIKKEAFDISGGWVAGPAGGGNTLHFIPFLKTLKRMHINTAHLSEIAGYTDQTGPGGLYRLYPLKFFHKLQPLEKYDREPMLPRIHAVEFLGEPQYGGGRPVPPQEVWKALEPYGGSRLATTLTNSEERVWRGYMGLSDYPHYDAYRVTAPSPDSWRSYDRWEGVRIGWGAPLETIGEMCRSLREMSRPAPTAYWSQGPHAGWGVLDGRRRTSPTPDEIRLQAYHALAGRITSLYWFNLSLKSILKFPDTLEEITRVGREIRLLEDFYLEGDAYRFRRLQREGKPDWDLASVVSPQGAVLFALDLDYFPDPQEKVFRFRPPRPAVFEFSLPPFLGRPAEVFRIDADGVHPAESEPLPDGIRIRDSRHKVAVYVAARSRGLRPQLEKKWLALLQYEKAFEFDPARNAADLEALRSIPQGK